MPKHLFDRKQNLLTNCGRPGNRLKLNTSKQLDCQLQLNQLATVHYVAEGRRERQRERGRKCCHKHIKHVILTYKIQLISRLNAAQSQAERERERHNVTYDRFLFKLGLQAMGQLSRQLHVARLQVGDCMTLRAVAHLSPLAACCLRCCCCKLHSVKLVLHFVHCQWHSLHFSPRLSHTPPPLTVVLLFGLLRLTRLRLSQLTVWRRLHCPQVTACSAAS